VLERLFAGRRIAEIELDGMPASPVGVVLDNTMPMVRLDDAEREQIRRLAASPDAGAAPVGPSPAALESYPATTAVAADDGRVQVMAEYFDVMRGFLDQQRGLIERLSAGADTRPESGSRRHRRDRLAFHPCQRRPDAAPRRDRRARRAACRRPVQGQPPQRHLHPPSRALGAGLGE
jgi:hypothetical protein